MDKNREKLNEVAIGEERWIKMEYVLKNPDIDNPIRNTLARMNKLGMETSGCCSGHDENGRLVKFPFIIWNDGEILAHEAALRNQIRQGLLTVNTEGLESEEMDFTLSNESSEPGISSHLYLEVKPFQYGVMWKPKAPDIYESPTDLAQLWGQIDSILDKVDHKGIGQYSSADFLEKKNNIKL